MYDATIKLIARELDGKDSQMHPIYKETFREIFCRDESISRSEFYSAGQIGIEIQALVIINPIEYEGEKLVEYQGKRMTIYRRYERSENEMELYLQLVVGKNGGSL